MRENFQHFYNNKKQPAVTVCYLDDDGVGTAVGMSICSALDHPARKVGRGISLQRAKFALTELSLAAKEDTLDLPGLLYSNSVVNRQDALDALYGTDFCGGEAVEALDPAEVYKIFYVNSPGFRFSRKERQKTTVD